MFVARPRRRFLRSAIALRASPATAPALRGALIGDSADRALKAVAYKRFAEMLDDLPDGNLPVAFVSRSVATKPVGAGRARLHQSWQSPDLAAAFAAQKLPPPLSNAPDCAEVIAHERQARATVIDTHRFSLAS